MLLRAQGIDANVTWKLETASTNDDAKEALAAGASSPVVVLAELQTRGRGRSGAAWLADPHSALLLSVGLRPDLASDRLAPVTLAVGDRIASYIAQLAPDLVRVKWPNDIELDGKKVAGILVEAQSRAERLVSIVVGVGVNVGASSFPPELAARATSLALAGIEPVPHVELAAMFVGAIVEAVALYEREGLAPFLPTLRARDALFGERVRIEDAEGVASGIDDVGRLLVRTDDDSVRAVASGHVERVG